jgi:hypothetical protein
MSAAEALSAAHSAGIRITIDGGDLVLDAPAPPPPAVIDLLARHKTAIVKLLHPGSDVWSTPNWQEFFEERASIAEFEGGLPRDEAQGYALSRCVAEWLRRNPARSASGRCALCGESSGMLLPYLTGYSVSEPGHTWLHHGCSPTWHQQRRAKAVAALRVMGISTPAEFSNDPCADQNLHGAKGKDDEGRTAPPAGGR